MAHDNQADHPTPAPQHRRRDTGRSSVRREQLADIDMALRELERARNELANVPEGGPASARKAAMMEPISRLDLVRRFCASLIERHERRRYV